MDEINKIGLLITKSINKNNSENKMKLLKIIEDYKNKKEDIHNKTIEDISYYLATYENKRNENRNLYNEYLERRFVLYKKWYNSKNKLDLDNLFKLEKPNFEEIPEIYTKKRPNSYLK